MRVVDRFSCLWHPSLNLAATSLALVAALTAPAHAQRGAWLAGAEASADAHYAYLGYIATLPGETFGQGWVQRYWVDYGEFEYEKLPGLDIDARAVAAEAAIGRSGSDESGWWVAYLGARYGDLDLTPDDRENDNRGRRLRVKIQLEAEYRLSDDWKINAAASHLIGDPNYWSRLRLPYSLGGDLRVGPELTVQGDSSYNAVKLGVFLGGVAWDGNALTFKLGAQKFDEASTQAYAGIEFYRAF